MRQGRSRHGGAQDQTRGRVASDPRATVQATCRAGALWHIVCCTASGSSGSPHDVRRLPGHGRCRRPRAPARRQRPGRSSKRGRRNPSPSPWRKMAAYYELVALAGFTHARPDWEIDSVEVARKANRRSRRASPLATPFCELRHFRKEGGEDDPKVLLVAPMSGHFATLLRGTLRTLLRDHQVYRHRLDQPAQRQAGGGRLRARRLHPAPDRFRPPHRRGLPHRRRLPADGQRADRHRRARRRGRQRRSRRA